MKELIEENCKRCKNYEICQSSGCEIKKQLEKFLLNEQSNQQYVNEKEL
ncbi:MAG: hypothetical protein HFI08_02065 [Bacilli bacterium]|jgi:hypothetical protein|nr:hypothetical protein [Bacilli bacterium]